MPLEGHGRRLQGWDYSKGASFFITLSLEERRPLFGHVVCGKMCLNDFGWKVLHALEEIPRIHPEISLFGHVVMPDHVHFNCHLAAGLPDPLKLLGRAIAGFKAYTTRLPHAQCACCSAPAPEVEAQTHRACATSAYSAHTQLHSSAQSEGASAPRLRLWRLGYHDHLCLSREFIDSTERYIAYNPLKWELMYGVDRALRVQEPLASPRLDLGAYWKGVGNTGLLGANKKLVSLRVSRSVTDIASVVARMERAADMGYVVMSGFISKGEQAVRDMLCAKPGAKLIRVRPSCIPNARFRPESAYVRAFAEGRCLEIGRGNDEVAFGRGACLDLNEEIIRIATAEPGLAIYFTPQGATKLAEHL